MLMEIRFHLDEHVDHDIARGLRHRGIDVTTTTDAGLLEADDSQHIIFARRENRVIFTNDPDFLRQHQQGVEHAGIAYCARTAHSVGVIIRQLAFIHDCMTAEEMHARVEFI